MDVSFGWERSLREALEMPAMASIMASMHTYSLGIASVGRGTLW